MSTACHHDQYPTLHPALRYHGRVVLLSGDVRDLFVPFANRPFVAPVDVRLDSDGYPVEGETAPTEVILALAGHPACAPLLARTTPLSADAVAAILLAAAQADVTEAEDDASRIETALVQLRSQIARLAASAAHANRRVIAARAAMADVTTR